MSGEIETSAPRRLQQRRELERAFNDVLRATGVVEFNGRARTRVKAYAFQSADPPTQIQLWNAGENPTDYGVHIWNDRSVAEVMQRYEERGNPLQVDIDHNYSGVDVPVDGTLPSGGYARLEIRDGAPWLVFDWSAYAIEQIATKQRRFLSPEYDVDTKTGEIIALFRVSLVADAATHNARLLARAPRRRDISDVEIARCFFAMAHEAKNSDELIRAFARNIVRTPAPKTRDLFHEARTIMIVARLLRNLPPR